MYRVSAMMLVGCTFHPGGSEPAVGDAHGDARGSATRDAAIDVPPDAPINTNPTTTDHAAVADTFLYSGAATTNYSDQTSAIADGDLSGGVSVVVIRFDVSSLSVGTVVTAAELHIWADYDPGAACSVYQLLESWNEATTTWLSRDGVQAWTTTGAAPPSRGTTSLGTIPASQTNTEYVVALDPAVVASWITPATNFGLVITNSNADGVRFTSHESGLTTQHAFVRVTHVP
jgi:hypothetical protein